MINKLKSILAILTILAAFNSTSKAPPNECYYRTMGWACSQTTTVNSHKFFMTYYPGGYTGMSLTRNGVACGSTTGTELFTPNWTGDYVITAYNGSCYIQFSFHF